MLQGCAENAQNRSLVHNKEANHFSIGGQQRSTPTRQSMSHIATGFFITNEGHFLTSYHVIKGKNDIWIKDLSGRKIQAQILDIDEANDVAIGKVNMRTNPIPIGTQSSVEKGDEVLTLGYPLLMIQGNEQKASFGRVNAFSGIRGNKVVYQIDVPVQPGNSGGPLLNERGVAIGVVKATFNQMAALRTIGTIAQGISYAVKSDRIIPMLKRKLGNRVTYSNGTKSYDDVSDIIAKYERSVFVLVAN